jgi:hypothetical protein
MDINWKAVVVGVIAALIIYITGAFAGPVGILRSLIYTLAPLIGGFSAAYIKKGDYVESIMNGGLAGGISGFAAAFIILGILGPAATLMGNEGLIIAVTILNAITALVIGAVLGLIGGIIGILIKGQGFEKGNAN